MRAEISEGAKASEEDSCEESVVPRMRTKPPRPRKKSKEPLFEEDVVEGFAFLAFKNYEDLEVSIARGWQGRPGRGGSAGRAVLRGRNVVLGTMVARGTPPSALHLSGTRVESARPPPPCTALPHMLPQHADVYAAARRSPPGVGVRGQGGGRAGGGRAPCRHPYHCRPGK